MITRTTKTSSNLETAVSADSPEQTSTERALQATLHRLEQIFAASPLAMIEADEQGNITRWNPAAERIFGWSSAEAVGKNALELLVPGLGANIQFALNDVVVNRSSRSGMIELEVAVDGVFMYSQRADGLIVATPTGSTAYSLSAGGPIMHPKLDAIVVVPMYPHTLSSRPIVVSGDSTLSILVSPNMTIYPQVSCDGQNHFTCAPGDTVTIQKKPHKLRLIHPLDHNYYEICRTKLGWGSRLGDD